MFSEKFTVKKLELLQRLYGSLTFLLPSNFAVVDGLIFPSILLAKS